MRHIILSAMLLTASTLAFGEDLPENAVITSRSTSVSIYDLNSVAITNDATQVDQGDDFRVIRVSATLELGLRVEGNLCASKPQNVYIQTIQTDTQTEVSLQRSYSTDPFSDILSACAAYSAPRNVTVALRLNEYAFDTGFEKTFALAGVSNDQGEQVLVKVRYDEAAARLVAAIIR